MSAGGVSTARSEARTERSAAVGGSPRALTGGEEKTSGGRVAKIDWLNFTWLLQGDAKLYSRKFMAEEVLKWLQVWLSAPLAYEYGQGLHGFTNSVRFYALHEGSVQLVSIVAFGGTNQRNRAYLEITGTGCQVVKDWRLVHHVVTKLAEVSITRLDLCTDFLDGEYTPMQACDDYGAGLFQFARRMAPKCWQVGDWAHHTGQGRTFYVGKRENGKQCRVYEKGKQLGCPFDPWVRFEVELHNRDREIPLDALLNPTEYFAGAFPICQQLIGIEGTTIHTMQEEFAISLDRLIDFAKLSYGKLINHMKKLGYPADAIVSALVQQGVPARLAKADWQLSTLRPDRGTFFEGVTNGI